MPSTSAKQHHFMEAIAHNPTFAAKAGVKQSVGKEFASADDAAGITKTHRGKPASNYNPAKNLGKYHHPKKTSSPAGGGVSDPNGAGQKTRPGY